MIYPSNLRILLQYFSLFEHFYNKIKNIRITYIIITIIIYNYKLRFSFCNKSFINVTTDAVVANLLLSVMSTADSIAWNDVL